MDQIKDSVLYRRIVRGLYRYPTYFMTKFWGGPGKPFFTPFGVMHRDAISRAVNTPKKFILIGFTRGMGKTKIFGSALPIWLAWAKKYRYMLLISHAQRKSMQTLRDIGKMIKDPDFMNFFGDWEGKIFGAEKIHLYSKQWKVDMFIQAVGQGQSIFGSSEYTARPDILNIDDIEDLEVAKNNLRINDLMNWFFTEVMPAASLKDEFGRTAKFMMSGTPLDRDCFHTRMMALDKDIEIISYPCLIDNEALSKRLGIPMGESIWPERVSKEEWHKEREMYIRMGAERAWMSQFMMKPVPAHAFGFKNPVMITQKESGEILLKNQYRVMITVDAAYTQKNYSDYTAWTVCGHFAGSQFDVLESGQGKIDQEELYDLLDQLQMKYVKWWSGTYVESLAFATLNAYFTERNIRLKKSVVIDPLVKLGKFYVTEKNARIAMVLPYHNTGMIRYVENENDILLGYLRHWSGPGTRGADDLADALSFNIYLMEESEANRPETTIRQRGDRRTDASTDIEMTLNEWERDDNPEEYGEEVEYGSLNV